MKTQNRKEIFLKALANGEVANIKPLTREEILLKKQAERENASGGGAGGGGAFVVNITPNDDFSVFTADKTYNEIADAFNAGNQILCMCPAVASCFNLIETTEMMGETGSFRFSNVFMNGSGYVMYCQIQIQADNTVTMTEKQLQTI